MFVIIYSKTFPLNQNILQIQLEKQSTKKIEQKIGGFVIFYYIIHEI